MGDGRRDRKDRSTTEDFVRAPDVEIHTLTDTGVFPNNQAFPLLIYRQALNAEAENLVSQVQKLFEQNHWGV